MAVPASTPRIVHTGDGSTVAFTYPFPIAQSTDLDVYVGSTLQATSAYTVTGAGNPAGGTVTFAAAPANGASVVLARDMPVARPADIAEHGDFRAQTFNYEYDRIYMILQDQADRASRTLALPSSVVLPTTGKRQVSVDYIGATSLSTYDSDTAYTNAAAALTLGAEAKAIAQEALAQTRPDGGAVIDAREHTLVAGTSTYRCAEAGLPAPSVNNVLVWYDTVRLRPGVDYTLSVDGESVVLAGDVVSGVPDATEYKAGSRLGTMKIAGGLISSDLSAGQVITANIAAKAITDPLLADGTAKSVRAYDADGRPSTITGTPGQVLMFGSNSVPGAAPLPFATSTEARAGASTTKLLSPAVAGYGPMLPLFVGSWALTTTNGAMQVLYLQNTSGGNVSLARTSLGSYRLTHPAMLVAPVVTFVGATGTPRLAAKIVAESTTATVIESWSYDNKIDAGVVVVMYGALA